MVNGKNSGTTSREYGKPYPSFPLSPHKRGWCKRINGSTKVVCGHLPPDEALRIFLQKSAKLYGLEAPVDQVSLEVPASLPPQVVAAAPKVRSITVVELKDKYLAHKLRQYETGEYAPRSLMSVKEILPKFADAYPGSVADLMPEDFANYRAALAKKYEPNTLNRHVTNIRAMFSWSFRNLVIRDLPRWGDSFEKPGAAELRKHRLQVRARDGKKLLTGEQIRKLLSLADDKIKAMVLLGINCAMGNSDIARLPLSAIDFTNVIIDFPRPKTGEERRVPLWKETVAALKVVAKNRTMAADKANENLLFLTDSGLPLVRVDPTRGHGSRIDYVGLWFGELRRAAGLRDGLGFYALRHTFQTIAGQTTDTHATSRVMGHTLPGMAAGYVQEIGDDRLRRVTEYVRGQVLQVKKSKRKDRQVVQISCL